MKKGGAIAVIGILSLLVLVFVLAKNSSRGKAFTTSTQAEESDPNFCQNSCSGWNRCDVNNPNSPAQGIDPNYNDSCCAELASSGDAFACPWPQRGYCTDDQCNAISGERQRCGGPRHSWCNLCISNNCPGYGNTPVTKTPVPTTASPPTNVPTNPPAGGPTIKPEETQPPEPTSILRVPPNESPKPTIDNAFQIPRPQSESVSKQFEFPSIQFPKIALPNMYINLVKTNQAVRKPLGFFEYLFDRIIYYDSLFEKTINSKIDEVIK